LFPAEFLHELFITVTLSLAFIHCLLLADLFAAVAQHEQLFSSSQFAPRIILAAISLAGLFTAGRLPGRLSSSALSGLLTT